MGDLLGASLSTIYRWEGERAAEVAIEPAQHRLLLLLEHELSRRDARGARALARDVGEGIAIGGGLLGVYRLLHAAFGARA